MELIVWHWKIVICNYCLLSTSNIPMLLFVLHANRLPLCKLLCIPIKCLNCAVFSENLLPIFSNGVTLFFALCYFSLFTEVSCSR